MSNHQKDEIKRVVGMVSRRERLSAGLAWFSLVALALAVVAVVLAMVDRLGAEAWVPWTLFIVASAIIAVLAGIVGWWRSRPLPLETARQIDWRLGLKDRLSSALACSDREDPFARALVEDARTVAGSPQVRESTKRRFRVSPPPFWWATPALAVVALVITFFGQWDLLSARQIETVDLEEVRANAVESVDATVDAIKEDPALSEAMADAIADMEAQMEGSLDSKQDEESIRREALKRVSELDRRLEDLLNGTEGQALEQLEESLKSLNSTEDSPIKELVEALSKADFGKAEDALSALDQKIQSSDMTQAQRDQAAAALKDLAEQLRDLSSDQQALSDALKQAGLDPGLASDPEALKKALEQASQLNETQKQQLKEMAESSEQVKKMLEELAEATEQACSNCKNGKSGGKQSESQQACKGMSQQLSQIEQLQDMINKAKSARSACQSQCDKLGQGLAKQGACNGPKPGVGGMGGQGQSVGEEVTASNTTLQDDSGSAGNGPVVSSMPVERASDVGTSGMTFTQARQAAREGFDEAFNESRLPRQYHEALKHYFGDQAAVEKAVESDAKESTEASDEKPAEKSNGGASGGAQ
ncbi:MAG: hypothetical protein MK116_04115 [Phycisphaerales bacterium]|nr:hypothetical protein [Phycisphaerales bacterium]